MKYFNNELYYSGMSKDGVLSEAEYSLKRLPLSKVEMDKFIEFKRLLDWICNPNVNLRVPYHGCGNIEMNIADGDGVTIGLSYNPLTMKLYWDIEWTSYGNEYHHRKSTHSDLAKCLETCVRQLDMIEFSSSDRQLQKIRDSLTGYEYVVKLGRIK